MLRRCGDGPCFSDDLPGAVLLVLRAPGRGPAGHFLQPLCIHVALHCYAPACCELSSYRTLWEPCRWEAAPANFICSSVIPLPTIKEEQFPYLCMGFQIKVKASNGAYDALYSFFSKITFKAVLFPFPFLYQICAV